MQEIDCVKRFIYVVLSIIIGCFTFYSIVDLIYVFTFKNLILHLIYHILVTVFMVSLIFDIRNEDLMFREKWEIYPIFRVTRVIRLNDT